MRDVLVHVRDLANWAHPSAYATDMAARVNGTLTGVHVEPPHAPVASVGADRGVAIATGEAANTQAPRAGERIGSKFAAWATAMGARQASWQIAEGDVPSALARLSVSHDLVIVDRNPQDPIASVRELGEIVITSRAPVILVPPRRREATLDCIALAWNHSEEALAAIHAARPLLAHATKIVLLEGGTRDARLEQGWSPAFEIGHYLSWEGFRIERQTIRGESSAAGELLIEAARRHRADLLVMGAYGRSRLSEWALGGATRSILFDAPLPVFFKH